MIELLAPVARAPRAPQAKAAPADPGSRAAAFNLATETQAEDEREQAALQQLMLAQLKDEDEVMKKWIAMIS
jgi:thioredoxin-like negative regulator of GroEL